MKWYKVALVLAVLPMVVYFRFVRECWPPLVTIRRTTAALTA